MRTLELLPLEEFKVLKIIQVVGPEWNLFKGYLPYLRTYDPANYDSIKGDFLDEIILKSLQQTLPQTNTISTYEILFKGQIEEIMNTIEGASNKEISLNFFPFIPFELASQFAGKKFTGYSLNLSIRIHWGRNNDVEKNIQDVFICIIDYDKIDKIIKTIRPIMHAANH